MARVFAVLLILLIAIFATKLRVDSSEARLAHADEGEQAYTYLKFYLTDSYAYSPDGAHGGTLYFWAYFIKKTESIFREPSHDICDLRLTLIPIFLLSILAFFALKLDLPTLVFSIAGWSVSALSVLYSLYFVQEIFFSLFVFLAMCYFYFSISRQRWWDFIILGVACGLAQATKETFVLVLAGLFLPCLALAYRERVKLDKALGKKVLACASCAFFVYALLYSSFGTNPRGIVDGISSYLHFFDKSASEVHSKEFLYYAKILFIQKSEGIYFGEILITIFALVGAIIGCVKRDRLINYISGFCLCYFLILSLIPYKTPWLLLSLIMPMCVLFGYAFGVGVLHKNFFIKLTSIAILLSTLYYKIESTTLASQRFANDPRNCFTYVHSSSDLQNLLNRIAQVKEKYPDCEIEFAMKNSPFPIPYYLIKYKNIAYNTNLENRNAQVIATDDPKIADSIDYNIYQEDFFGLRENLIIYLFIEKEIFEEIIE